MTFSRPRVVMMTASLLTPKCLSCYYDAMAASTSACAAWCDPCAVAGRRHTCEHRALLILWVTRAAPVRRAGSTVRLLRDVDPPGDHAAWLVHDRLRVRVPPG